MIYSTHPPPPSSSPPSSPLFSSSPLSSPLSLHISTSLSTSLSYSTILSPLSTSLGFKLSHLNDIIQLNEGYNTLKSQKYNIHQMRALFIQPQTEELKISYCEHLKKRYPDWVGKANVFLSHSWDYLFTDITDLLNQSFIDEDHDNVIIWFDLFSVNQHTDITDFKYWSEAFHTPIRDIKRTVMALSPWNDPIPLTRAWCLWELFCTFITDSKFEIIMTNESKQQFIQAMLENPEDNLTKMLSNIDVRNSKASKNDDKEKIFQAIGDDDNFSILNKLIFERLRIWVIETIEKERNLPENIDNLDYLECLFRIYEYHGNYEKVEELCTKYYELRKMSSGDEDELTLKSQCDLAKSKMLIGEYSNSLNLYLEIFDTRKNNLDPNHRDTLNTMNKIGLLHLILGNYTEAKKYYEECLSLRSPEDTDIANSVDGYLKAVRHLEDGSIVNMQYDDADDSEFESLPTSPRLQPESACQILKNRANEPGELLECLKNLNNLGKVLLRQGSLLDAFETLERCLKLRLKHLGARHLDTLITMNHLARVCLKLGDKKHIKYQESILNQIERENLRIDYERNYKLSEYYYSKCYKFRNELLGHDHPDTLSSLKHLGIIEMKQGKYENAKEKFQIFLELSKSKPNTRKFDLLKVLNKLTSIHITLDEFEQAEKLIEECFTFRNEESCVNKPQMLLPDYNLGLLRSKQKRIEESRQILQNCLIAQTNLRGENFPDTKNTQKLLDSLTVL